MKAEEKQSFGVFILHTSAFILFEVSQ